LNELSHRTKQLSLQPDLRPIKPIFSQEQELEIFEIKAMLTQLLKHQQAAPTQQLKEDQLQELDKTLDEQLAGIDSSLWKLEQERDAIKKLAKTYKQDVVKEVESATRELDYKRADSWRWCTRTCNKLSRPCTKTRLRLKSKSIEFRTPKRPS